MGSRIKERMETLKLDVRQVAQVAKVTRSAVYQWLDGSTEPSALAVVNVAELLGTSEKWLVTGLGPKERAPLVALQPDGGMAKVNSMDTWNSRIRERIAEMGMSQSDLARSIGLSKSRVDSYLQAIREPPLAEFMRIVSALGVTSDWVLFGGINRAVVHVSKSKLASRIDALTPSMRRDVEGYLNVCVQKKNAK